MMRSQKCYGLSSNSDLHRNNLRLYVLRPKTACTANTLNALNQGNLGCSLLKCLLNHKLRQLWSIKNSHRLHVGGMRKHIDDPCTT